MKLKKIVDKDKLPAVYYTSHVDLPRANNNTVEKFKNAGITFEYIV